MAAFFPVRNSLLSPEALLTEVVSEYDIGAPTSCKLWRHGWNDTYLLTTNRDRFILRVYRAQRRQISGILFELELLLHLDKLGVSVSKPIVRRDDKLVRALEAPEGLRHVAVFTFARGNELAFGDAKDGFLLGRETARLHAAAEGFSTSERRRALDLSVLMEQPLQVIEPHFDHRSEDWAFVQRMAEKVLRGINETRHELDYGICHGDLHGGNAHVKDGRLTLYDFDLCGEGWRAYDLAAFRWFARRVRGQQWNAFLQGYRSERDLGEADVQAVPFFMGARHFWLLSSHILNAAQNGCSWLNDEYLDRWLSYFQKWEAGTLEKNVPGWKTTLHTMPRFIFGENNAVDRILRKMSDLASV